MKNYSICGHSENWALELKSLRPLSKVCSWAVLSIMELISGGVATDLARPETVGCLQVLRLNVLVIGSTLLLILIIIVRICIGPGHFENLIFWSGLLDACPSPFSQIGLIRIKQISESYFELLIHLLFLGYDSR